mgnify:CR=1 FL=1
MQNLFALVLSLIALLLGGCADKSFYSMSTPAASQADQYVETDDLSKLPSKKIAITSFGIEYDTNVVYAGSTKDGLKTTGSFRNTVTLKNVSKEQMQLMADNAYIKLVKDLKAAGYDITPYETYKETPAYQSLINIVGKESPVSIAFKYGDSETLSQSDALVFAPTGMVWYSPNLEEVGSRRANTLTSLGTEVLSMGRAFSGGKAVPKAEVDLADALNATLLKIYYVVSPVRSYVESKFLEGTFPGDGRTIVGSGETRLAFRTPGASTMHFTFSKKKPPLDGNAFVRLKKDVQMDPALNTYQDIENHLDAVREMFMTKLKSGK